MSVTGSEPESGQTLLEMLVVVGILGLVTALVFPRVVRPLEQIELRHARTALIGNLRLARAAAIRQGQPVALEAARDGRNYGWNQTRVALPQRIRINGDPPSIGFQPDGSSTGGSFVLTGRVRRLGVAVDPASGAAIDSPVR